MPAFYYLVPGLTTGRLDGESRFQYWNRCLLKRKKQLPSGGVKIIYQHCDLLNQNGYSAVPVHLGDFTVDFFPHKSKPIHKREALQLMAKNDILICPEIIPGLAAEFPCEKKVAFIQNWALTELCTGPVKRYEDFGFSSLLSCSQFIRDYMKDRSSLQCDVVTNGIDLDVFHNAERDNDRCRVVVLNRRNIADAREAFALLDDSLKKEVEFIVLENKYSQGEIAEYFRSADIFLAIGYPEGFALPPLEAMASGCAVVGFTGGGGLEHMLDGKTALVAADGNVEELATCLKNVLTNSELKEQIRSAGVKKAQEFSLENMEKQLVKFAGYLQPATEGCTS
jgi:glycosyltransferase involved in cell wall biosynthesis